MAARLYQVSIVSVLNGQISLEDGGFQTADAEEALAFSETFNHDEMNEPLGASAIVQVVQSGVAQATLVA